MLKYVLLGFLNYTPMTGYELKQFMDESTANFWHAKQSQIYTTLKKLEEGGMLESHIEAQEGRPDRRVYEITKAGRNDLDLWLALPETELESRKESLLVKLFFSANTDKEKMLTQLRLLRDLHQRKMEHYETTTHDFIREIATGMPQFEKDAELWDATRRFGVLFEEMFVRWLDETIERVEKW
jgi:PadR family transcriptional regulator AphA